MSKGQIYIPFLTGSAGAPPAVSRASRDTLEFFGGGAESPSRTGGSGRGARAPQFRHLSLIRHWSFVIRHSWTRRISFFYFSQSASSLSSIRRLVTPAHQAISRR